MFHIAAQNLAHSGVSLGGLVVLQMPIYFLALRDQDEQVAQFFIVSIRVNSLLGVMSPILATVTAIATGYAERLKSFRASAKVFRVWIALAAVGTVASQVVGPWLYDLIFEGEGLGRPELLLLCGLVLMTGLEMLSYAIFVSEGVTAQLVARMAAKPLVVVALAAFLGRSAGVATWLAIGILGNVASVTLLGLWARRPFPSQPALA